MLKRILKSKENPLAQELAVLEEQHRVLFNQYLDQGRKIAALETALRTSEDDAKSLNWKCSSHWKTIETLKCAAIADASVIADKNRQLAALTDLNDILHDTIAVLKER